MTEESYWKEGACCYYGLRFLLFSEGVVSPQGISYPVHSRAGETTGGSAGWFSINGDFVPQRCPSDE